MTGEKGFTLVELVVVMAVLSVLTGLVVPRYYGYQDRARNSVLETNALALTDEVELLALEYDTNHLQSSTNYDTSCLNGRLENDLENRAGDNRENFVNPISGKKTILNYHMVNIGSQYIPPAVFITWSSKYSYDSLPALSSTEKGRLKGSLIVFLQNGVSHIDVYYVDKDGQRSPGKHVVMVHQP